MGLPIFRPYAHQQSFLEVMGAGCKRAVNVWHRRAGKDMGVFLGWMVPEACRKTGTYFYLFPTYAQGKKIIWDGIDSGGTPILHYVGAALGLDPNSILQNQSHIESPGFAAFTQPRLND